MIGSRVSHYEILEKLGEGGMGVVYKARDTRLDRLVALKFLSDRVRASEEDKARFLQEARSAAALNHPNVCSVIDIEAEGEARYIVMEYVGGETLRGRIHGTSQQSGASAGRTPLSVEESVAIGVQIAAGLAAAHEKHIVHRDIKSENIMVSKDGQAKIMDFGLAKLKGTQDLTRSGSTIGTIGYMSPEQIQSMEVDHRSDLWALGVVLYEMFAGTLPFRGEHEAAVMYEVLNTQPRPLRSVRPDVPEALEQLVMQLLEKDPAKRLPSAAEVMKRLKLPSTPVYAPVADKSIAVLYFENMSSEKESEYLCAGITEDIITDLSKIKELKVVSRGDVQPFRNKEVNARQVGETLRVRYVLDGSVRKAGTKIRITAQLIDVKTGFQAWAERYDRLIEDIFDLQDEIAQNIVKELKVSLTDSEKLSLGRKPTDDLRAYDFYMRGRELLYKRGRKNTLAAMQMFEHAVSLDPKFTLALAGLAEAYTFMYSFYDGRPELAAKTIDIGQRALGLDPDSTDARFVIGTIYFHQKRYSEAKGMLEQVIKERPDYYDAVRWLGVLSDIDGKPSAALRYYEQCSRLKPYSEEPWMHIEMTYRRMGDPKASDEARRKCIEVGEQKLAVNPEDVTVLSRLAGHYAHFGDLEKAFAALRRVVEIDPNDGLAQYNCACTYASIGRRDEALACLRNAVSVGYSNVTAWIQSDPDFDSMRDDPEFNALLAAVG